MRRVVLYIAMSLDGFIAEEDGSVDWLGGEDPASTDMGSYPEFIESVDTVILGWKTYYQIVTELSPDSWVYADKQSYVMTHREMESSNNITFTGSDIGELISSLKAKDGKDIWICGGAGIVNQLIALDLIDRFTVSVIPMLLGGGIRLFDSGISEKNLRLVSTKSYNGITDLVYERRS